jgi:hypothetical protein
MLQWRLKREYSSTSISEKPGVSKYGNSLRVLFVKLRTVPVPLSEAE